MMEYTLVNRNHIMGKVFAGLCASLVSATFGLIVGQYVPTALLQLLMLVELVMIFAAMFIQRKKAIGMTFVLAFTFISGMTLFPIIAFYASTLGAALVMKAVAVSAVAFFAASVVASRTSFDFSFLGGFLLIGIIALLVMGLVSAFIGLGGTMGLVYSMLGVAVFVGYILYDVNRIAHLGISNEQVPWVVLSLYLDFINLFLFVLRLLGILQDRRS